MIARLAERDLETRFGVFHEVLYGDSGAESIALIVGDIAGRENVICRIHSACIGGHVFNSVECTCAAEISAAQEHIQRSGKGVIIYLDQEGKGNGHLGLLKSIPFKEAGHSQSEAYVLAGFSPDARDYRPAAEILADLKVGSIVLLTENSDKAESLRRHGVNVTEMRPLSI